VNLLGLRKLISRALDPADHGKLDLSEVKGVELFNPLANPGPWGMLVTVDDGTGTGRESIYRLVVREAEHVAQFRDSKARQWNSLGKGRDASEVAWLLDELMQRHGFRHSEMYAHREDLEKGHVLVADDGYEFRVVLEGREDKDQ
jgi:hypothetical protein